MSDLYGEIRCKLSPEEQENFSGKKMADDIYGEGEKNYVYKSAEFTDETGTLCKLNRKLRNNKLDLICTYRRFYANDMEGNYQIRNRPSRI